MTRALRTFVVLGLSAWLAAACSRMERAESPPTAPSAATPAPPPATSTDSTTPADSITPTDTTATPEVTATPEPPPPEPRPLPASVSFIALGATSSPSMTQLSIEEELAAVEALLGPDQGLLVFAGGVGTRGIQVADRDPPDRLLELLGTLAQASTDHSTRLTPLTLRPHFAATRAGVTAAWGLAAAGDGPLTLWLAGHGEQVERPEDAAVALWGGAAFTQAELAELLGATRRPLTLIATQCYGAGFAEALPPGEAMCGAFASVWDLPASGCDPSPDAPRKSYGTHLRAALTDIAGADLDGDGRVSLAEAHVQAVIAVDGIDVPVLSSQHALLREVDVDHEGTAERRLVEGGIPAGTPREERRIIESLTARLELRVDELDGALALASVELEKALDEDDAQRRRTDEAAAAVRALLYARWPALEDAWHPDFRAVLDSQREAVTAFLRASPEVLDWDGERDRLAVTSDLAYTRELAARRLERAVLNLDVARSLARLPTGSAARSHFDAKRACERARGLIRNPSP